MKRKTALSKLAVAGTVMSCLLAGPALSAAGPQQTGSNQHATAPASGDNETHSWTIDQAITSSVREAWALGGRTEQGFFQIVKALAEVSAQKRGVTIPDNTEAGKRAGEWIKTQAKKDPDQLLYVIVDQAVQYSARKNAAEQAQPKQ